MKIFILAASLAAAAAPAALAQDNSGCPGATPTAATRAYYASPRAEAASAYARDTAAREAREAYDARVAAARENYRWRPVRYEQPLGGDYDALYGPGAYHQNYELAPHNW
jgi:hypothetical protein